MKGDKEVIRSLNKVLGQSLIAINQYFLHARIARHWGLEALNESFYKQSIAEMKWSDDLIARILLLGGLPNLQDYGKMFIAEDVPEMIDCNLRLEKQKFAIITDAVTLCETQSDYVSRQLLVTLKDGNEEYEDWLETQEDLIESIGVERYIQSQMNDDDTP
ncbi:bacterioferritin [Psychrobacter sp. AOP22-C1-22]|uniref:bacterioferritin n=1 Tax=unclassified Psychrobacter TaxID=196806 RepID=UPI0017883B49|nr:MULTISPECIES: bacterioferritin [unclassified Psychrobacter]MBE0407016.1 bacterioferritin [Psychrobacter sp. FME6]MBE0443714.1 bacterioferritin [Psychrobacter sp. FME5]MDN5801792.1 bacterioferritin [Psychrobacter sp.]MDN5891482.1 bacterioferritin [Psychrobacter sp.]